MEHYCLTLLLCIFVVLLLQPCCITSISTRSSTTSTTTRNSNNNNNGLLRRRPEVVRYRARVAYDGHGYQGFQLQQGRNNARTVQGVIEDVLHRRLNYNNNNERIIKVVAAGRTDAGVHARGQAIHFDIPKGNTIINNDELARICVSLNKMLPPDVRIWNLQKAPEAVTKLIPANKVNTLNDKSSSNENDLVEGIYKWNVLYDSTRKLYSYRLCLNSVMDPLERYTRWHPIKATEINIQQLQQVLQCFVGTYDFRAFAGSINNYEKKYNIEKLNTIRTVYSINVIQEDDDNNNNNIRIDFLLKGALYKQVRNMVGAAIAVCHDTISIDDIMTLLTNNGSSRCDNITKPAPPEGLVLEYVYFDNDDNNNEF